jgi:hypothetical protein
MIGKISKKESELTFKTNKSETRIKEFQLSENILSEFNFNKHRIGLRDCSKNNIDVLLLFLQAHEYKLPNNDEVINDIIIYFSNLLSNNLLNDVPEMIFRKLDNEVKMKIFEKLETN